MILEDLNYLEDTQVFLRLAHVIETCRQHDCQLLITCYLEPNSGTLARFGLDPSCVVDCPYFSEEETHQLVRKYGGNPERWGRLAHITGANGHPQLTHAFVAGFAARGWPVGEIETVVNRGLSSQDTDTARDTVRRRLASRLPEDTRSLLYRLSLVNGRFSRPLALTIGETPPQVSQIGECMDQLIGPWIEAIGNDLYRVSPLASSFGREMLTINEQRQIHESVAVQMVGNGAINASDINSIVLHAIQGESPEILAKLACSLFSLDAKTFETLAEYPLIFRFLRTDKAIYPKDRFASGMLRLTQFRLAAVGDGKDLAHIATALFREISGLPDGEPTRALEAVSLATVLCTMGIANFLDDWLSLLVRLKTMAESNEFLRNFMAFVDGDVGASESNLLARLFNIGITNLVSVARLEHVINKLDELDRCDRELLLTPMDELFSDYFVFINGPWVNQAGEDLNAADAVSRVTAGWRK